MKRVADYFEFTEDRDHPAIMTGRNMPIPEKEQILAFMEAKEARAVMAHSVHDHITDTRLDESVFVFTAGEYVWTNEEVYHFKRYDLKLNDDFIRYVKDLLNK